MLQFTGSAPTMAGDATSNENGQFPGLDGHSDQAGGKPCLSFKINSIFSGSRLPNRSYHFPTHVFHFFFPSMVRLQTFFV